MKAIVLLTALTIATFAHAQDTQAPAEAEPVAHWKAMQERARPKGTSPCSAYAIRHHERDSVPGKRNDVDGP